MFRIFFVFLFLVLFFFSLESVRRSFNHKRITFLHFCCCCSFLVFYIPILCAFISISLVSGFHVTCTASTNTPRMNNRHTKEDEKKRGRKSLLKQEKILQSFYKMSCQFMYFTSIFHALVFLHLFRSFCSKLPFNETVCVYELLLLLLRLPQSVLTTNS